MVAGNGIFYSRDKGQTWNLIESIAYDKHFRFVNKIWVSPDSDSTLLVATNTGIYKTYDAGATWDSVFIKGHAVQDLIQNPLNSEVIYAGVNALGVIKTTDQGNTWINSFDGMGECYRVSVSVSGADTSYVFAGVEAPGSATHVYQSRDGGRSWELNYNADGLFTNFHGTQGWFNNVVAAHPFDKNKVFVGGVNLGMLDFGSATYTSTRGVVRVDTTNISERLAFVRFGGSNFGGALANGIDEEADVEQRDFVNVEIRFDSTLSQYAHRFTVPEGEGAGVPPDYYEYMNYVSVPFQVWDIENNRQLMVSFRDQDRNGEFNPSYIEYDDAISGREYIFIHAEEYNPIIPSPDISGTGGYEHKLLYFLWPTLPNENTAWSSDSLKNGIVDITYGSVHYREAYTTVLADDRLNEDLHVDHHDLKFIITDAVNKSFTVLDANDGGLGRSMDNGITWEQISRGYLTTQFYGMAKRAGRHEYIGGMQDNGTWQSPLDVSAQKTSEYDFRIEGDGFETLWHPWYPQRILGSSYNNFIKISNDFGETWQWIDSRILGDGPFITKLSHSRENPDLVFAVGSQGVYRHPNFGLGTAEWETIDLGDSWAINNTPVSSHHVKVSRANPKVVWAGAGMFSKPDLNIFLSKDYGITFDSVSNYTERELGLISGMSTHPTHEAQAFLLFSYQGRPKVLRTYDYGQSWEDISGFEGHDGDSSINGFPDVVVNDLLVIPNDTNNIWVATEIGLFESKDNGASWQYSDAGLPNVSIWQLDVVDGHVLVATHGRGLWTADLGISSIIQRQVSGLEFSIKPNPAKDLVSVKIKDSDVSSSSVSIYDLSGRKHLEEQFHSYNEINLDVSSLPEGTYVIKVKNDVGSNTKKLLVL